MYIFQSEHPKMQNKLIKRLNLKLYFTIFVCTQTTEQTI